MVTRREVFATSVTTLALTFNRHLEPAAIEGYWLALRDLSDADFARATSLALQRCKFMPVPAELRELAGVGGADAIAAASAHAWDAVVGAIRKHGSWESVDFGPLVNAVVRNLGGWIRLCDLGGDRLFVWARKEFDRVYALFAPKDSATLNGAALAGEFRKAPIQIAIAGHAPPRALPERPSPGREAIAGLVAKLAEAKSA